jgi:hypothetical protein
MSSSSLAPLRPERAHHSLPVQGSLTRYNVRYLDPAGSVQHLALTSTWCPEPGELRARFWQLLLRGIEQAGCKVLEVNSVSESLLELDLPAYLESDDA